MLWVSFDFFLFEFDGNGFEFGDVEVYLNIVGGNSDVMDIFDGGMFCDIFLIVSV